VNDPTFLASARTGLEDFHHERITGRQDVGVEICICGIVSIEAEVIGTAFKADAGESSAQSAANPAGTREGDGDIENIGGSDLREGSRDAAAVVAGAVKAHAIAGSRG